MLKQRFVFAVSLFVILAVGNVWADTASGDAVKTAHDVYTDLSTTETGIAGVSYVNKMVNAAGAAAQDAENHAASAGASALSAAAAASAAQTAANNAQTTANKVSNKFDNTSTVKNAIVTTDANGKVAPVAISDTGTGTYVTGVTVSGGTVTLSRGTPTTYSLPTASASTKGGVKIGANVNVATDGTISVPTATSSALGVVKTGTNITNNSGTISVTTTATPTKDSVVPLTSGGAYTALAAKEATANKLKTTDTTAVTDTNKDTLYPSVGKTQAMIDSKVAGLDKSDTAETGKYVSAVSETDGVITVSRASLPTVGNATLTIQRNGTTVDTFTANATTNKTINITDNDTVYTLPNATTTTKGGVIVGSNISVSNGTISVPAATTTTKGVVTVDDALSSSSSNPVQNKAVNAALSGKQATISDLSTIRSGAAAGATAVQPSAISDMQTKSNRLTTADTTSITDANKDTLYPTVGRTTQMINELSADVTTNIDSLNTALNTLSGNVGTLSQTVADNKTAAENADKAINEKIGTVAEGKTVVEMIEDAQSAATYDDAEVKADIAANATAINNEVTRAKAAEEANATAAANAQSAADAAQATANAAIPKPTGECLNTKNKCVLTFNGTVYTWEVIERATDEVVQ